MAVNTYKQNEQLRTAKKSATLLRMFSRLLDYKKEVAGVLLLLLVTVGVTLVNPLIIERAVNVEVPEKNVRGLIGLAVFAAAINEIWFAGTRVYKIIMARISNRIVLDIREEMYAHIQTLGLCFFDSRATGKILSRIIGDVDSMKDVFSSSVTTLIPSFFTIITVSAIMLVKSPALAMAAFATLPFLAVGVFVTMVVGHRRWQEEKQKSSNINAYVHENFSGIRIIQSFNAEEESRETFRRVVEEHRGAWIRAVLVMDAVSPVIDVTWAAGSFLLYYIAVSALGMGETQVGTILAFSTYLSMFWSPIRNLASFYNQIVNNLAGAERIFEIMDQEPEIRDSEGAYELPVIEGRVVFDHVDFAYPDDPGTPVLTDVSFDIAPGSTIALVGPTGAGKTTITNLIARFYDVTGGEIRIDSHPVNAVTVKSLRSQMGIMTQENFLFSDTVRENIRYGKLDATEEEIVAAAKAVGAHEFIMKMEKGYDTKLDGTVGLSVGQRQLIAFARTLLSEPRILILDEATSSIDTRTELMVQRGIAALLKGRTSFVVAHRLSTIKKADQIFVIDEQGIRERGTHEELLQKKGEYYKLYQAAWEE
ncbi:MAG: ABC transporter ATP-binding protein/permease [Lachnospiraceae bacterium]|nr:ABC transporter ATP-binding protein/permease [Lachnospiraceae bacterium]